MKRAWTMFCAGVCILTVQAISSHAVRRKPFLPSPPSLFLLPMQLGNWQQTQDTPLEPDVQQMLGPDDSLERQYRLAGSGKAADLFVAYYKTQLQAKNAHDPKVCLPGSGWNPRVSRLIQVAVPGQKNPLTVNYYRIAKQDSEAVVLYWFQTYKGVYTFEQQLKFHRMLDAITDNRTDMALVRVVVPVDADGAAAADALATQLAQLVYPQMLPYFPHFPSKENPT